MDRWLVSVQFNTEGDLEAYMWGPFESRSKAEDLLLRLAQRSDVLWATIDKEAPDDPAR